MASILADTEHMLAHGKMDLPLSLCFAAVRGDDLLLHQLLKRGSDPNEVDTNGRTALVRISFIYICVCAGVWAHARMLLTLAFLFLFFFFTSTCNSILQHPKDMSIVWLYS